MKLTLEAIEITTERIPDGLIVISDQVLLTAEEEALRDRIKHQFENVGFIFFRTLKDLK